MMTVQRRIIELLRVRSEQLDAEWEIPDFLRLTDEQRRRAWIKYDAARRYGQGNLKGAGTIIGRVG
jgi:hypothetical protein